MPDQNEDIVIGPIATHHIVIDGLSIRYATDRRVSSGIPILLTAPFPESLFAFLPVWESFAAMGPVIAVDLPGFGRSEGRQDLMSPSAMGLFLVKLLDVFELERVHAIVPDVGTLAALFAASTNPERFASIVAGSGGTAMELLGEPLVQIAHSKRSDFDGIDGGEQVVGLVRQLARVIPPAAVIEDYRLSAAGDRWNAAADFVRAYPLDLPRLAALLPGIDVPVLVLSGGDDPFVPPSNGEFLKARLPHCEAQVIEAGHFVWEDAAEEYARCATEWISRHDVGVAP
ncbi:alpha/beta fold hydrolase [Novosphingobium sp. P6W]|uniref:alpha/beta fold hydrolase n=1 Tax=Novosphingobium sp. P6W TaxID=1609758 RepID=UPI0005C6EC77|nr:alpha/beta hydrolase [Novosphingobium sp. P6W]AXB80409.1 alpha/beta hydrolase [Novosphingobium sp. P6W]